ncbi:cystathionine beta-lyase [Corallococcus sp. M34]|uniref:cystathionine beta-lyase n=1 Tax=Citreicoccus inhibens TaxID=2849499 RepID=UPI001C233C56|nr:cystathionine beta-lyase [Citreicoccus inhibens]MBU8899580.1 cystathionine beta-lyase [Citreicoccus inhibens]
MKRDADDGAECGGAASPALDTTLIHVGSNPAQQHGFVNPPLYRGSTVLYGSVQSMEETARDRLKRTLPAYGRFGSPTCRALESALAELEGGYASVCTVSGLAAITTAILAFVETGDHILVSDSAYMPTRNFCDSLRRFGIEAQYYDPCIGGAIEALLRPNTRLVFLESPGSMTFEVQDIPAISEVCRARGIVTLVDNTWATPLFLNPLTLGVDVVIHSATKYITGHADSLLGAIVCNEAIYPLVRASSIRLGQCAGADDVYLGLRGLRTLTVRLRQHQHQALTLAHWLVERREVAEVLYPALPGDRGHALWKRDFKGASGLLGVVLQPHHDKASVDAMLNALRLFGLGHSWGGFESLIVPGDPSAYRLPGQWQRSGALLRIHVGLEDMADLKADLAEGFRHLSR